jgi:hypothetical protein
MTATGILCSTSLLLFLLLLFFLSLLTWSLLFALLSCRLLAWSLLFALLSCRLLAWCLLLTLLSCRLLAWCLLLTLLSCRLLFLLVLSRRTALLGSRLSRGYSLRIFTTTLRRLRVLIRRGSLLTLIRALLFNLPRVFPLWFRLPSPLRWRRSFLLLYMLTDDRILRLVTITLAA